MTYSQYVAALTSNASQSAIQSAALSALNTYDGTPYGSDDVEITSALGTALGFTGLTGTTTSYAPCTLGNAGCYNAIITITNDPSTPLYYDNLGGPEPAGAYDFYGVVEHETDEVLGTASCMDTQEGPLTDDCDASTDDTGTPSAVDLFRYNGAGSLAVNASYLDRSAHRRARISPTTAEQRTGRTGLRIPRRSTTRRPMAMTMPTLFPALRIAELTSRFRTPKAVPARMPASPSLMMAVGRSTF